MPYTGVKTSILYFTNCHIPNENKEPICFYEVKNDGYTLDNHLFLCRPIEENDLKYIDYIDFNNQKSQFENNNFRKVEYENIKENDYHLIANRYLQTDDLNSSRTKWETAKLKDLLLPINSKFQKIKKQDCITPTALIPQEQKSDKILEEIKNIQQGIYHAEKTIDSMQDSIERYKKNIKWEMNRYRDHRKRQAKNRRIKSH